MTSHLGLDLGGTNIKWVVLDQDGTPLADGSLPTEGEGGPDHVVERLALAGHAGDRGRRADRAPPASACPGSTTRRAAASASSRTCRGRGRAIRSALR